MKETYLAERLRGSCHYISKDQSSVNHMQLACGHALLLFCKVNRLVGLLFLSWEPCDLNVAS